MLDLYKKITAKAEKLLNKLLELRLKRGKEDVSRLDERRGVTHMARPENTPLIWLHAASVGEAQSTLILITHLSKEIPNAQFLVTSGTVTSARLMAERLPKNAFHQFYPIDHPQWVENFLNHWKPNLILWMESELWPNMLRAIKARNIPTILVNARLSNKSFYIWRIFSGTAKKLLSTFDVILTQTKTDESHFKKLGGSQVITTDNIKYSAAPLPYHKAELEALQKAIHKRPCWVYASTHDGEEILAGKIHSALTQKFPDLLTIIVPRHPERRHDIEKICTLMKRPYVFRGEEKQIPKEDTQLYIVDTMGELGLFYKLTNIALIGRSFSNDGGGGHNPIEAAQLDCAVLTGPNIQFQKQLFAEMFAVNAAHQMEDKTHLLTTLRKLLGDEDLLQTAMKKATEFSKTKTNVIHRVMENLTPYTEKLKKDNNADAA